MSDPTERLKEYLKTVEDGRSFVALTGDASTREYFRIGWNGVNAVACAYPEPFTASINSYKDVTGLFAAAGLPVAELLDIGTEFGIVVQEDLGNRILRDTLQESSPTDREELVDRAIALIARIQTATDLAFERRSLASRLRFDTQKLSWELNYF